MKLIDKVKAWLFPLEAVMNDALNKVSQEETPSEREVNIVKKAATKKAPVKKAPVKKSPATKKTTKKTTKKK